MKDNYRAIFDHAPVAIVELDYKPVFELKKKIIRERVRYPQFSSSQSRKIKIRIPIRKDFEY